MKGLSLLPTLFFVLTFIGCGKIDYDLVASEEDESVPDIYMEGVVQIQSSGPDSTLYYLTAEEASIFTKKGQTHFEEIKFQERRHNQEVIRRGEAGRAEFARNNDASLSEGVVIDSPEDGMHIEGDSFSWDEDKQLLNAPKESDVLIIKEGESEITGAGFEADFNRNEISFTQSVEGTIYHD